MRVRIAAGHPAAHTSRVTVLFAGYGVGTIGRVRFGPVSGFSSGFPAHQRRSFLLPSTRAGIRAAYFYVAVTTARLNRITELFDTGTLVAQVGTVLPLEEAHIAHVMLGGAPHKRGKIVLSITV